MPPVDRPELVVDPFMGSGAVGIACDALGRAFIGGDINHACLNFYANRARDWRAELA